MGLYKKILHALSIPCLVLKPGQDHFHVVDVNDKFLELTQQKGTVLIGINAAEAFPNLNQQTDFLRETLLKSHLKVIATAAPDLISGLQVTLPASDVKRSSQYLWDVENIPILDDLGETEYILMVVKKAKQIAFDAEHPLQERYALAIRATRDLIFDWDLQRDIRLRFYQDEQYFFGYAPEEVEGKFFWHDHIHPQDQEKAIKTLDAQLSDSQASFVENSYRIREKNGNYANVVDRGYIIRDQQGKAVRLVGVMQDVTELKAQKGALEVAMERHNMAMKATNEMIWDWDLKTNEIERSSSFPVVYGYSNAEAPTAWFWIEKVHPDDREEMRRTLMEAINDETKNQWEADYLVQRADGAYRHVIDRAWISRDQFGKATRIVGATLDVTEMKKAYDRIRQQNTLLREIAWDQSHMVRSPLSRLLGLMHYMEQADLDFDIKSEVWQEMTAAATELDEIIRKIVKKSEDLDS